MSQFPQRTKSTFLGKVTYIVITLTLTITKYARTYGDAREVLIKKYYIYYIYNKIICASHWLQRWVCKKCNRKRNRKR